jgi:hypothetical protein
LLKYKTPETLWVVGCNPVAAKTVQQKVLKLAENQMPEDQRL